MGGVLWLQVCPLLWLCVAWGLCGCGSGEAEMRRASSRKPETMVVCSSSVVTAEGCVTDMAASSAGTARNPKVSPVDVLGRTR